MVRHWVVLVALCCFVVPCFVVLCFVVQCSSAWGSEDEFPYVARVRGARAALRAGPGRQYYVCNYLPRAATIEVFERRGTDWLAVRPSDDCFSWVRADQVEMSEEDGLGEVIGTGAVSWIGSGSRRDSTLQWQVRLEDGEPVEVIGEEEFSPVPGVPLQKHLKIRPPSGEFRWIRSADVEIDPQYNLIEETPLARDVEIDLVAFQVRTDDKGNQDERASVSKTSSPVSAAGHFVTPKKGEAETSKGSRSSRWRSSAGARKSFDQSSLEELNLALSEIVANESDQTELEPLRLAADRLVNNASNSLERAKAKRFLERVREFEEIYRRQQNIQKSESKGDDNPRDEIGRTGRGTSSFASRKRSTDASPNDSDLRSRPSERTDSENGRISEKSNSTRTAGLSSSKSRAQQNFSQSERDAQNEPKDETKEAANEDEANEKEDTRFDGRGRLSVVYSNSKSRQSPSRTSNVWPLNLISRGATQASDLHISPPYALVDRNGTVLQFVTPAPGLNLNRYVAKEVGIMGNSRYEPSLRTSVITAERVVNLERHR